MHRFRTRIRSTYSFVCPRRDIPCRRRTTVTRSRPVRAAHIQRGLKAALRLDQSPKGLARSRTSWSFLCLSRSNRRRIGIGNLLFPYHVHHLYQFPGHFDIAAVAILFTVVGRPIKHRPPFAAGADGPMRRLDKRPFERPISTPAQVPALGRPIPIRFPRVVGSRGRQAV
jgi:hypothetical protein